MSERELRELMCEIGRRAYSRGFVAGSDGNFSCRLSEKAVLITPTLVSKGFMASDELITVDYDGNKIEGSLEPSSEIKVHLAIYKERPEINAVVHTHAPYATARAVVGRAVPKCILPEVEVFVGEIPIAEPAPAGTLGLVDSLAPFIKTHLAFLLSNHGVVTIGKDLLDAFFRMEVVEQYCRILTIAKQIGEPRELDAGQMKVLYEIRDKLGTGRANADTEG